MKINEFCLNFSVLLYGELMLIKVLRGEGEGVNLIVDSTRFWPNFDKIDKLCPAQASVCGQN